MSKLQAFIFHLACSALVVGLLVAVVAFQVYGVDLFVATDSYKLVMIIAGIDLVVGPILTAVVYRRGKPRVAMDVATIVLFQLVFLGYGAWVCWQSRPVALIIRPDLVEVVFANESDPVLLRAVAALGEDNPLGGPKVVSKFEQDKPEENIVDLLNLMTYGGTPERVSAFAPPQAIAPVLAKQVELGRLSSSGTGDGSVAILPLLSLRGNATANVRLKDAQLVSFESKSAAGE